MAGNLIAAGITTKMKLSLLLKDYFLDSIPFDCDVAGLSISSQNIKQGDLFFAYPGVSADGRDYIDDAINAGASAIIQEGADLSISKEKVIKVTLPKCQEKISNIASIFYKNPCKNIDCIAVTGTNGKTSYVMLMAQLLVLFGKKVATVGTLGAGIYPDHQTFNLTTPDPILVMQKMAEFKKQGVEIVLMEVSSHALDQGRVNAIPFSVAAFTNLTRDHLDYHGSMESYGFAKLKLFRFNTLKSIVLNSDDAFYTRIISSVNHTLSVRHYGFSTKASNAIHLESYEIKQLSLVLNIAFENKMYVLKSHLLGKYNIANVLSVIATAVELGFCIDDVISQASKLQPVAGRMEALPGSREPLVIIDYAHTPDALQSLLQSVREFCRGSLICVFGCGGNRDQGKRPLMAAAAEKYADQVIVTSDNPRLEDPQAILNQIALGFSQPGKHAFIADRKKAIAEALKIAKKKDVVVIAGKGHETYQIIGKEYRYFSDHEEAQNTLLELVGEK